MFEFFANAWKASSANKAMFIAGGIILLGTLGALVYALVGRLRGSPSTGDEAFMTTPNGEPIHWDKELFPIMVAFDPIFPESYQVVYRSVANQINEIIGKQAIDIFGMAWMHPKKIESSDDVPIGHMYLTLSDPEMDHVGGSNSFSFNPITGAMKACFIKVSPGLDSGMLNTTMRHEVGGHGFGLAHDRLEGSVMYATVDKRSKDFTDKDKQRLKEKYG